MVMVLSVFDIHPIDKDAPIPDFSLSEGYTSGVIWCVYLLAMRHILICRSHPERFQCRIVPHSAEAVALIISSDPKERH